MGTINKKTESVCLMPNTPLPMDGAVVPRRTVVKPLVLIAENDECSRDLLTTILRLKGGIVIEAEPANLIKVAEKSKPNLIIVDVGRPFHLGLEVIKQLRQHELLRRIPTIITSGNPSAEFREEVLAAGYGEFLLKPIDFDLLEQLFELHLMQQDADSPCH
jgi:CheY-like chemotaxis protein